MAKTGHMGGRGMGRRGARVGLPRDAVSRDPGYRDARPAASPAMTGGGERPRSYPVPPPPPIEAGWPDEDGRARAETRHDERLAVARLFDHLDRDTPRPYRADAYQDAPRIAHNGRVRFALSGGGLSALIAGGVISLFLIFVAGFMSAVVIFGEPDPDGQIAIRTTPVDSAVSSTDTAPAQTPPPTQTPRDSVVSSAEAGRDPLPPPSPEIAAAEAARDRIPAPVTDPAAGPAPDTAPTPPVSQTDLAATTGIEPPPQVAMEPVSGPVLGPEGRVDGTIIFPAEKPAPPARVVSADPAAPARLGPPGGTYSLQFGAFQDRANAEALVRELSASIDAGIVEEVGATGATLFHVRAGAFETRAAALRVVRTLRDENGFVTFVHVNRATG